MQRKILFAFITILLIGVFTTGIIALSIFKVHYLNEIEDKLISNSMLIKEFLIQQDDLDYLDLNDFSLTFSNRIDARVTFIDLEGWVTGDSHADITELENHKNRPEIVDSLRGNIGISRRYSYSLDQDMIYVAVPFEKENNKLAVIRLSVSIEELSNINRSIVKYIFISILAGLFIAVLLGYRYVKTVTYPIRQLTNATKKIAQGNFGEKVYYRTDDELGILAENFNIMSTKLHDTIDELQESNTTMKAILTSMINGVIALDHSKKVMFINLTAEDIFGIKEEDIQGRYILECVRNNILDDIIHKLISTSTSSKEEVEIYEPEHRILNIYSSPIRLTRDPIRTIGVLIIIQDITEIRKLERMRKDFVANVSHELKTPLTSIKGFIETLKGGAVDNKQIRDKFLDIIDIEANRLTSLIQDLLLLSEIENRNNVANKEKININKSIEQTIQFLGELARQKDIEIIDKVNNNLPSLYGSSGWFKQMIINLIDNAIKYTPNKGKITVKGYHFGNNLVIKIKDTGIGIKKEHKARLFERFYRVDKARSRQVGGTGLGLAIVKHIVLSFKGTIDVKSEVDRGTEFIITLPIEI